jgi:diguanylate cyclase (GGDEF)-like protein
VPIGVGGATGSLLLAAFPAASSAWHAAAALGSAAAAVATALVLQRATRPSAGTAMPPEEADRVLHPSRRAGPVPTDGRSDLVAELLGDARDALGGHEAVFWQLSADAAGLGAAAWASGAERPRLVRDDALLPVIGWSAHERLVQCRVGEHGTTLVAAPVTSGDVLLGALSVHADGELPIAADQAKLFLARHARRLGELVELVRTRGEFELQSERSRRLLDAAHDFQAMRSVDALAGAVCAAALGVSSAERAAFVRWDERAGSGRVEGGRGEGSVSPGQPVAADSYVGAACESKLPALWEDPRAREDLVPVFGAAERGRTVGSLGVVPLGGRAGVIGAIVLEGGAAGSVEHRDLRSVKLLAALAAGSLDALDDFETAEREANTDKLTGLPNRRAFAAQFAPALDRADRFGEPVAVLMCDIDQFKAVNDTHGHDAGDAVLLSVGATLQRGARAVDSCARFGGEEFVLLLPRTNRVSALEVAERLRRAIELRPVKVAGRELRVTASFGIAVYPATVTSRDELLAAADRALYQAKRDGRNCVRCADATSVFD